MPSSIEDWKRAGSLTRLAEVRENGFFQLGELAPGRYAIEVTHRDLVTAPVPPVDVASDREHLLEAPILLTQRTGLTVLIDPPVDAFGRPWRAAAVTLDPQAIERRVTFRTATTAGRWEESDLEPGRYEIWIEDAEGSRWASEETETAAEQPLEIHLPLVLLEGTLLLGDEPLAAALYFNDRERRREVRFQSDEEGRFGGYLPRAGKWSLRLVDRAGRRSQDLPPVEVEEVAAGETALLEVVVPDTRLAGRVVDESGEAVAQARVDVLYVFDLESGGSTYEFSDSKGEFEIRGLPPGTVSVQAVTPTRVSKAMTLELDASDDEDSLELVLGAVGKLTGKLLSPAGLGLSGARITAVPRSVEGWVTQAQAVSGPDGSFELQLKDGITELDLWVMPRGFAARMIYVAEAGRDELPIQVGSDGGTLTLRYPSGLAQPHLLHAGSRLVPWNLRAWGTLTAGETNLLSLPMMEPGEYALCWTLVPPPQGECSSGTLFAGSHLELEVEPRKTAATAAAER